MIQNSGKKLRLCILCGGKSPEHDVSVHSAINVIDVLNNDKFDYFLVGIDKSGTWFYCPKDHERTFIINANNLFKVKLDTTSCPQVMFAPERGGDIINIETGNVVDRCDVVFVALHGKNCEDGTVQGILALANVPFTGAGVLGSALGMDKVMQKHILHDAGISVANGITLRSHEPLLDFTAVVVKLGKPFFSKPAGSGSSIAVNVIHNEAEYIQAVSEAFRYDTKVLLEEFIDGREIECFVFGNENPEVLIPGEVILEGDLYSYEAKYKEGTVWEVHYPAKVSEVVKNEIMRLSKKTFEVLDCAGFIRVDLFLKENDVLLINEINTIPGFVQAASYPAEWEELGITYSQLITRMVELAIERHDSLTTIKTLLR
jgi:D-alanine-D-alanine ligase